jgi:heme-degrading monooxygenase HmoA
VSTARIAHYRVPPPGQASAVAATFEGQVLAALRRRPGFVAYEVICCGPDELISISTWRSAVEAEGGSVARAESDAASLDLLHLRLGDIAFRHLPAES